MSQIPYENREQVDSGQEMPVDQRPQGAPDDPRQRGQGLSTADMAAAARPADVREQPAAATRGPGPAAGADGEGDEREPLFASDEAEGFRGRWGDVQTGFVDSPRQAVEEADRLVAAVMQRLAQVFADERSELENQWEHGEDVSTEDLRQALRRYRSFFDRLLSI
ncbi:MAG TPA: hypothetical protein VMU89_05195 [Thermomicrobiaceae bacterium]|nr:hypothetical protein [Thermomicrobiaceae bacterium]